LRRTEKKGEGPRILKKKKVKSRKQRDVVPRFGKTELWGWIHPWLWQGRQLNLEKRKGGDVDFQGSLLLGELPFRKKRERVLVFKRGRAGEGESNRDCAATKKDPPEDGE